MRGMVSERRTMLASVRSKDTCPAGARNRSYRRSTHGVDPTVDLDSVDLDSVVRFRSDRRDCRPGAGSHLLRLAECAVHNAVEQAG